jgi:predicted nucleotidyltransferase component of viral defense system
LTAWIRVETCPEIIAKKMWHRGNHAKARDRYDLCAVADAVPQAIDHAAPFLAKLGAAFLAQARGVIDPLLPNAPG